MIQKYLLAMFFTLLSWVIFAQLSGSEVINDTWLNDIQQLIDQKNYRSADRMMRSYLKEQRSAEQDTRVKILSAHIELVYRNNPQPYLDLTYMPDANIRSNALWQVGKHYFENQKYKDAIYYLEQIQNNDLSKTKYGNLQFILGYAYYQLNEHEKARDFFQEAIKTQGDHTDASHYYLGILAYQQDLFDEALTFFLLSSRNADYSARCAPYISDIYVKNKTYTEAIAYINEMLPQVSEADKVILLRLLGDVYFEQKLFKRSVENFQNSLDISKFQAPVDVFYKLAYSYEKLGELQPAIENYRKSGLDNGILGQLSAYQLGYIHLSREEYNLAIGAFDAAQNLDFDIEITETAAFMSAKASLAGNNFKESTEKFFDFEKQYPTSEYQEEARELLVQGLYQTSDYDAALSYLGSLRNPDRETQKIIQSITLIRGRELFNSGEFDAAIPYLKQAASMGENQELSGIALRLLGDCYFGKSQFAGSIPYFQQSLSALNSKHEEYDMALYGLGYAFFNSKKYDKAMGVFSRLVKENRLKGELKQDAAIRLADCYFVEKSYENALGIYHEIREGNSLDYVWFQSGNVYYLTEQSEKAIALFQKLYTTYPGSFYADNALMQEAGIYFETARFEKAFQAYHQFTEKFLFNALVPEAWLGLGLSAINLNNTSEAIRSFEEILNNHLQHPVASDAILGLQKMMAQGVAVPELEGYLEKLNAINPDNKALELILFEQAKTLYFNQQYDKALTGLQDFVTRFSESLFIDEARFYTAEIYFRQEKWGSAIAFYDVVMHSGTGSFKNRAIDKAGKACLALTDYTRAQAYFHRLREESNNGRELYQAREGLMVAYLDEGQYAKAIQFADEILKAEWLPLNADLGAGLIIGKANLELGRSDQAIDALIEVMNSKSSEHAAEAYFWFATMHYRNKAYKNATETLLTLIANYGSQPKWTNRAYLLLVDNYLANDELFQAKATLNSIISRTSDEVFRSQAQEKMAQINAMESKIILKKDSL